MAANKKKQLDDANKKSNDRWRNNAVFKAGYHKNNEWRVNSGYLFKKK